MKNSIKLLFAFLLISVSASAHNDEKVSKELKKVTFVAPAIDCDHCKQTIMKDIPFEKGVKDVQVNIEKKEITVSFRSDKNSTEKLQASLKKIGYPAMVKPCCKKSCDKTCNKSCCKDGKKECTTKCDKKEKSSACCTGK